MAEVSNPLNPSLTVKLRVVMDTGSQHSYLTQRVKDALALSPDQKQHLSIATFGSARGEFKECDVVCVTIRTKSGTSQQVNLLVVPHICDPLTAQPVSTCAEMYSHLSHLELAEASQGDLLEVDMLIGCDYYWDFTTGETVRGRHGPVAINTTLGWVLSDPVGMSGRQRSTVSLTHVSTQVSLTHVSTHTLRVDGVSDQKLDTMLRSFWELESLEIQPTADFASDHFASTVQMKNGRYEVSLPWREYHEPLPDNYDLSCQRLGGLLRWLQQDPAIMREYNAIIREQLSKGIVEEVNPVSKPQGVVHYLPHHPVIRQDKETTKVKVVYDASARVSGPSLNECLCTGPKFNQRILEILLRFRSYKIAFVADIEKAFLMISVAPKDRDVLRFLWVKNITSFEPELITLRFARVVFGASSSPFLLNATIEHHLSKYLPTQPELVKTLKRSIYVDDVVCGADNEDGAYSIYSGAREILSHASFHLRKFVTNSPTLQARVLTEEKRQERGEGFKGQDTALKVEPLEETYIETALPAECPFDPGPGEQKVLGLRWNVPQDQLVFDFGGIVEAPTKRNVISLIGRVYDPLGFLSPVTVWLKMLLQELCKSKLSWDQPLDGEVLTKWSYLINDLEKCQPITLPRCYLKAIQNEARYQLYGFCDASLAAYARVIYLVERDGEDNHASFVVAKTRVSPLKSQTIPRLELLSALLLARLVVTTMESLEMRLSLDKPRCFTDSQVALFWIKRAEREWKPFVQNQVSEICKLVPIECWDYCSGRENPADIPSRGSTPVELSVSKLWRSGPQWLNDSLGMTALTDEIPLQCAEEMKCTTQESTHSLLASIPSIGQSITCERYSTIQKLYRVTAYVLKFRSLVMKKVQSVELTVQDVIEVEKLWILESQKSLMQKNFPMWKVQFGLFKDDKQIWRCGGRLQNANLSFSAKHPILLNKVHYLTMLIVNSAHKRVQHNGVKETLAEVRTKFWIIGGRNLVKSIIHKCVTCRRYEGKALNPPPAPPLPPFRVNEAPPFAYTAVDFAGLLYVRAKESEGKKVWICLFTCCVIRAIHLELVLDMSNVTFIRCVKRFSARRGLPRKFISDNAKTFKSAAKVIQTVLEHQDVTTFLTHIGVEWCFNLEKAPWWGGLFERLIRSVKRCLRKRLVRPDSRTMKCTLPSWKSRVSSTHAPSRISALTTQRNR